MAGRMTQTPSRGSEQATPAVSSPEPGPPGSGAGDALTAVLLQITAHAERLAVLDEREATHHQQTTGHLAAVARELTATTDRLGEVLTTAARQAAVLDSLGGLDQQVATLADRLALLVAGQDKGDDPDAGSYRPPPAPRWWKLSGDEREAALARLRAWVEQVYRPSYGHLAGTLGPCWDQHPLCLFGLDWLMELWSALYLIPERDTSGLAGQAEWQIRLLPALAEQMHLETRRCQHREPGHLRPQQGPANRRGGEGWRSGHEHPGDH
jgi:hypothetical protein